MDMSPNVKQEKKWYYAFAVLFVFVWTVGHSFFGIDLVDTGYYYYQYLHPTADNISYSTYIATLIGAVWIRLFPKLGLWGLNLLELILEYTLCLIIYFTFRNTFRKKSIIIGLVFCMVTISTYVNIFNYHQSSMFFCTSMLCFMYTGLRTEKVFWHLLAGAAGFLAVLSRFPCILTLVCIACILYWRIFVEKSVKKFFMETVSFVCGFALAGAVSSYVLKRLGVLDKVINDVFRMSNLSGSGAVSYGINNQFSNLIKDTLHSVEAAALFLVCACLIAVGLYNYLRNVIYSKRSFLITASSLVLSSILFGGAIFGAYYAMYHLGRAPAFIQLTSFSWFIYGIAITLAVGFTVNGIIQFIKNRCKSDEAFESKSVEQGDVKRAVHDGAIAFMGTALILLSFVGSAARAKHAILGMWFIVPLVIDRLFDCVENAQFARIKEVWVNRWIKTTVASVLFIFLIGFSWFVANTNNFDEPNLTLLTSKINNDKVKYLRTTERAANEVNDILEFIASETTKDDYMMVIGNPIMLYTLTDRRAYVRPWVTGSSYLLAELEADFQKAEDNGYMLPVVIEAKTDSYRGFSEAIYEAQIKSTAATYDKSLKVKYVREFMKENGYKEKYESDYFIVYLPDRSESS